MERQDPQEFSLAREGRVYVLRMWHEGAGNAYGPAHPSVWRASVREGTGGQRRYFASIDECIDYLSGEFVRW